MICILGKSCSANFGRNATRYKGEGREARNGVSVVKARYDGTAHSHQHESNLLSFRALEDCIPPTNYYLLSFLFEEDALQRIVDIQSSNLHSIIHIVPTQGLLARGT